MVLQLRLKGYGAAVRIVACLEHEHRVFWCMCVQFYAYTM